MTPRLIETDDFPFVFLSRLAERESWRKEIHRPIYHVHKWWAKRLGSIFRGILLGSVLPEQADLAAEFYRNREHADQVVLDPFMGSGTTIGEAHKLGMTAFGLDINPVAVEAVRTALGPMDRKRLRRAFERLVRDRRPANPRSLSIRLTREDGPAMSSIIFWVMQACCPDCERTVDLFPSYVIAEMPVRIASRKFKSSVRNAAIFFLASEKRNRHLPALPAHLRSRTRSRLRSAGNVPPVRHRCFPFLRPLEDEKRGPIFGSTAKLVLTRDGGKEYLAATSDDQEAYQNCSRRLREATWRRNHHDAGLSP